MKAVEAQKDAARGLLSTAELSEYLGIPVPTIYQWRHKGTGPRAVRLGKHLRFRVADVERWLDSQARGGAA